MTVRDALKRLVAGDDLSEDEAAAVIGDIIAGTATPAQIGGLMVALRTKGETVDEITGFARAARAAASPMPLRATDDLIDTCGTGGDGVGTFNISTVAAFVAAGAGCKVAKHGNRSNLSQSGSADMLEALGINIHMSPDEAARSIEEIGIAFLFAPDYHPGARHAVAARKEIGIRTIFNALGPLVNPSGCRRQLVGVYDAKLTEPIARVLANLGATHVLVVHGEDGLDEVSTTAPTQISEIRTDVNGLSPKSYTLVPEQFGLARASLDDLKGGDPQYNASIARRVLNGEPGAWRDIVVLNAGAAIYVAGRAASIADGVRAASESIDSSSACHALERLAARSGT
jgi:anthranilate phosphoribosyltransferase